MEAEAGKFTFGIVMSGVPNGEIPVTPIGPDKDHATTVENIIDGMKKKLNITALYADDEQKAIHIRIFYPAEGREVYACRRLLEDGRLSMRIDATKKDQTKSWLEIVYKKKN